MAFPTTPDPTPEDVLDLHLPMVGEGIDEALEEVVRRLQNNLPDIIQLRNQRRGWLGIKAKQIPKPAAYHIAPADLADEHINAVLVGISAETSAQGIGGAYRNSIEVVIYSIDKVAISPLQILQHWRRAALIRAYMHAFLSGCVNPEGRLCWRSLQPTGYSMIPSEWKNFTGMACTFRMEIPPTQASQ
jgi:hypothetical protein